MATLMPMCAGLVGPKSENVEKSLVLQAFLKGSRVPGGFWENEQLAENWRPGGGRGRVNPPPCGLVWRF